MKRATLVVVLSFVLAVPAWAITFGQEDEERHPNVGALMAAFEIPDNGGTEAIVAQLCSGTLLANNVFLTAGHCVAGLESVLPTGYRLGVSFETDVSSLRETDLIPVNRTYAHPSFTGQPGVSPGNVDLGVALLNRSPAGVQPANLPDVGAVDTIARLSRFTAVGFGVTRDEKRRGPLSLVFDGLRRFAEQSASQANSTWLKLSMNPSTGNGGACYGDSGGPHFLGTGTSTYPGTVMSVTSHGDTWCRSTDWTARVDTQTALDFITTYTNGTSNGT